MSDVRAPSMKLAVGAAKYVLVHDSLDNSPTRLSTGLLEAQLGSNTGPSYATRAALFADLAWAVNTVGYVYGDSTTAFNGVYVKAGASGAGSWSKIGDLPLPDLTVINDSLNRIEFVYQFLDTTTGAAPPNGQLKFDNASANLVTKILMDYEDRDGADRQAAIATWQRYTAGTIQGRLKLTHAPGPERWVEYKLTSVVDSGGFFTLGVTYVVSANMPFTNGVSVAAQFRLSADRDIDAETAARIAANSSQTAARIAGDAAEATARIAGDALKQARSEKGLANGYASLDATSKVPLAQIPGSLSSGRQFKGNWNASTNTPTIVSSVGVQGDFYRVSTAGSTSINGITPWALNDTIAFNGAVWQKSHDAPAAVSDDDSITIDPSGTPHVHIIRRYVGDTSCPVTEGDPDDEVAGAANVAALAAMGATGIVHGMRPGWSVPLGARVGIAAGGGIEMIGSGGVFGIPGAIFNSLDLTVGARYGTTSVGFKVLGNEVRMLGVRIAATDQTGWFNAILAQGVDGLQIEGCHITGLSAGVGINVGGLTEFSIIKNRITDFNESRGNGVWNAGFPEPTGIFVDTDGGTSISGRVSGNIIRRIICSGDYLTDFGYESNGIKANLAGTSFIEIADNEIDTVGQGIDCYGQDIIIARNRIYDAKSFGIALKHTPLNISVLGNLVAYCGLAGIYLVCGEADATGIQIQGNKVHSIDPSHLFPAGNTACLTIQAGGGGFKVKEALVADNDFDGTSSRYTIYINETFRQLFENNRGKAGTVAMVGDTGVGGSGSNYTWKDKTHIRVGLASADATVITTAVIMPLVDTATLGRDPRGNWDNTAHTFTADRPESLTLNFETKITALGAAQWFDVIVTRNGTTFYERALNTNGAGNDHYVMESVEIYVAEGDVLAVKHVASVAGKVIPSASTATYLTIKSSF